MCSGPRPGFLTSPWRHRFVFEHRDALEVALVVLGGDGGLHLVEGKHGDQRGEFAAADDVASGGIGVAAVRRFRAGHEVEDVRQFGGIEDDHFLLDLGLGAVGFLVPDVVEVLVARFAALAGLDVFLALLPVDRADEVLVLLRGVHFEQGVGEFAVVAGEEEPAVRLALAGAGEVDVDAGQQDLEGDLHAAGVRCHRDHAEGGAEVLLVAGNRHVGIGPLVIERIGEAGAGDDVFRVLGDEGRRVVAGAVGDFEDLLGAEGFRADARHARACCWHWRRPSGRRARPWFATARGGAGRPMARSRCEVSSIALVSSL